MDSSISKDIFRTYTLDYIGKYHFYEEEELVEVFDDGEYILENLKKSSRFDYNNASYRFTKYGNISEGITENNVKVTVKKDDIDVIMNGKNIHLDLIYKMEVKELEDHYRIATRASEVDDYYSMLLYINLNDGEDFVKALSEVKNYQELLFKKISSQNNMQKDN
ncbi:MAG: hypothetical protein Q4F66_11805 [Clostridium sp.]|nr:hypothetical protein [Clostridium sp.]